MRWYQSLGKRGTLRTEGPYRFTRNPQYVAVILVYLGFAIIFDSWRGLVTTIFINLWFLLAPLTEEPWLHEQFGVEYEDYCRKTPRFLFHKGFRSRAAHPSHEKTSDAPLE